MLFDAFGMTVSRTGTTPTPFGFVGGAQYQTDADSGLMLLGHRYYDASVGRFISSDPIQAGDNWYAYCENNPLSRIDPDGKNWLTDWLMKYIKRVGDFWGKGDCGPGCSEPKVPEAPKAPDQPGTREWPNLKVKEAIKWGQGEKEAWERSAQIGKSEIDKIRQTGIPKEIVEKWRDFYRDWSDYLSKTGKTSDVGTPDARAHLLTRILKNW